MVFHMPRNLLSPGSSDSRVLPISCAAAIKPTHKRVKSLGFDTPKAQLTVDSSPKERYLTVSARAGAPWPAGLPVDQAWFGAGRGWDR